MAAKIYGSTCISYQEVLRPSSRSKDRRTQPRAWLMDCNKYLGSFANDFLERLEFVSSLNNIGQVFLDVILELPQIFEANLHAPFTFRPELLQNLHKLAK